MFVGGSNVSSHHNDFLPHEPFTATLTQTMEAAAGRSAAVGTGVVIIDPDSRRMTATITTDRIAGITAELREGINGTAGANVFPMAEAIRGTGIWSTQVQLTESQFNSIRAGNYYFEVRSTAFPDGELIGQVLPQLPATFDAGSSTTFTFELTGSQVADPVAETGRAIGVVIVDTNARTLTASITSFGIPGTEAHIHSARPGSSGPVVLPLQEAPAGSGVWNLRTGVSTADFNAIVAGEYYLDIHTASLPNGAARGQIVRFPSTIPFNQCHDECCFNECCWTWFGGCGWESGVGIGIGFGFGFNEFESNGFWPAEPIDNGGMGFGFEGNETGGIGFF